MWGEEIRRFAGSDSTVLAVTVSLDGKYVMSSADAEHTLRMWDAETGDLVLTLPPMTRIRKGLKATAGVCAISSLTAIDVLS